jgi:EAL domain-containing protein (putative c-di-GMP-specific phosphodiesterase class I)/GGDEF domain-containing protein
MTAKNRPIFLRSLFLIIPLLLLIISEYYFESVRQQTYSANTFSFSLPTAIQNPALRDKFPNNPVVRKVFVTGFFSDWSTENPAYRLLEKGEDIWQKSVRLPPGDVQYKFVVYLQGEESPIWIVDPVNPHQVDDSYNGKNSVISIPDYQFYQLLTQILLLGLLISAFTFLFLEAMLSRLINKKMPIGRKIVLATIIIVFTSNAFLVFYQVFESRSLVKQGIVDSVHLMHLKLLSEDVGFYDLNYDQSKIASTMRQLLWQATTRVERGQDSNVQITLSDVAIFDNSFRLIHVQNRQQNQSLQALRAESAGFDSVESYYVDGVFAPLIKSALEHNAQATVLVADPSDAIKKIETTDTSWARRALGFSNVLVPITKDSHVLGYYAVAVQVKLYGHVIQRIVIVNLLLVAMVLAMSLMLLRTIGAVFSANLNRLADWSKRINEGDLDSQVQIKTQDEVQTLAENFAGMQQSLKRSFEKIEQQNTQLNKAAYFDLQTGLANRRKLLQDLTYFKTGSLIVFEFHEYQRLHDFLGDKVALQLINAVILRMKNSVDESLQNSFYRIAPNQLCLAVSRVENVNTLRELAISLISKISNKAFSIDHIALNLSAVAGCCSAEHLFDRADVQTERAELALQQAKQTHKDVVIYRPNMDKNESLERNVALILSIRDAIQNNQVVPFFQPIVSAHSKLPMAYECLVRIKQDIDIILSPNSFLSASKQAGLYQSISQIMFEKSIHSAIKYNVSITLNLSAQDTENDQSRKFILDLLKKHQSVANRITLEITETDQIVDYPLMKDFIDSVKELGCKIALDDFGAGYSNFTHLLSLNIDYIKIDGSLIKDLDTDPNALKITKAIVECARSLQIETVAEYVHSETIYDLTKQLGVDFCQGYYFGAPKERLLE